MSQTISYPELAPLRGSSPTSPLGLFVSAVVILSLFYSILSTGSMGGCLGGVSSDGGYVDSSGNPTLAEPSCLMMQLHPQSYVYLVLAAIALVSLGVIRRRQERALPTRTASLVGLVLMVTIGVAFTAYHLVFIQNLMIGDWRSGHDLVAPFLSNVTITRTDW